MSSNQSGEGSIWRNLIEADLVYCMVALPEQSFHSTQIPACFWFVARRRLRRGEILFMDACRLVRIVDRTHREVTGGDIDRIAGAYHVWRDGTDAYEDVLGFCKSTVLDEGRRQSHVLTPCRYVGTELSPDDREPFDDKMQRLVGELQAKQAEGAQLDEAIAENPKTLGFDPAETRGESAEGWRSRPLGS